MIMSNLEHKARFVTYKELIEKLLPYISGYSWAIDALHDLWTMGAPNPQNPQERLLLPTQFKKWWDDVCRRMGYEYKEDFYDKF
jgi:hypothetical protein